MLFSWGGGGCCCCFVLGFLEGLLYVVWFCQIILHSHYLISNRTELHLSAGGGFGGKEVRPASTALPAAIAAVK